MSQGIRWLAMLVVLAFLVFALSKGHMLVVVIASNVGQLEFTNELAIPPLLEPSIDTEGRKVFELRVQTGQMTFRPGLFTSTLGINGDYLGPTLRASHGDMVRVNVANALDEPTSIHWHGMRLPAVADGGPHQPINPGEIWSPEWTIEQPPATLWYHPHLHYTTGDQVYRGLAGLFIIDDPKLDALPLPDTYGVDDIPLIIQDRQFTADGAFGFARSPFSSMGVLGDEILVNGTYAPYFRVAHRLVRFRVLNASNNRIFDFGFDDDRDFWQIATDSSLLPEPYQTRRIMLSPGERAEIVVAFAPDDDVVLRSFPPDTGAFLERRVGGADQFDILRVIAAPQLEASPPLPAQLTQIEPLVPRDTPPQRVFTLGDRVINGQRLDLSRIDHVVAASSIEVWEITNTDNDPHNFHPHDVHFQILTLNGQPPPPSLGGWKDTVYVAPGSTVRIAMQFAYYTDLVHPYMFHCHFLTHEDEGMMGQFLVVEAAEIDLAPRRLPDH